MCEDIIPRASFYTHFFPHFYPTEPTSQPVNNHRLAVVYMVLSLGSIFDLNVPARSSLAFLPSFLVVVELTFPFLSVSAENKTSRKYYALARASLAWGEFIRHLRRVSLLSSRSTDERLLTLSSLLSQIRPPPLPWSKPSTSWSPSSCTRRRRRREEKRPGLCFDWLSPLPSRLDFIGMERTGTCDLKKWRRGDACFGRSVRDARALLSS